MTRELQISDAAQMSDLCGNRHDLDCFVAGAEWADSHSNWHKYPEEKPNENKDYLVYLKDPNYGDSMEIYEYSTKEGGFGYITANGLEPVEWKSTDDYVKAWMEKPRPPKFD